MARNVENESGLPIGATIIERAPFAPSMELAVDLARRGVSTHLVELVAGGHDELQDVLREIDSSEPHTNGSNGRTPDIEDVI